MASEKEPRRIEQTVPIHTSSLVKVHALRMCTDEDCAAVGCAMETSAVDRGRVDGNILNVFI